MKLSKQENAIHSQFSEYGRNAREWLRKCALLLPEVERLGIWRKKKFSSIYEYAAKVAGMSKSSVDDALWVLRRIQDKPLLKELVELKGIHAIRPVVALATSETEKFWAEKASQMSRHTLEVFVREYKKEGFAEGEDGVDSAYSANRLDFRTGPGTEPENGVCQEELRLKLKPELVRRLDQLSKRADFEYILEQTLDLIEERISKMEEKPEAVRTGSRHIPMKIEGYVLGETGGRCSYPGCFKPYKILHHTQRFALEKVHDPARLVPLCKEHEQLAHLGLIENEETAPQNWKLRMEPDKTDPKFYVDQMVGVYRRKPG